MPTSANHSNSIDWRLAKKLAKRVSGHEPFLDSYHYRQLGPEMADLTAQAEELVAAETGLISKAGPARAQVTNREGWIDANLASFQRLLRPVIEKMTEKGSASWLAPVTQKVSGTEVGTMLGWMSTRVLGQYDLLIIEDDRPEDQDMVYYVGPNVMAIEHKYDFDPRQFRLWLALHETTHRAQFTGISWLRPYFLGLIDEALDFSEPNLEHFKQVAKDALESRRRGEDLWADGGLPALLATPEQKAILEKIGGMMSLLEGHGDVTMDRAGAELIPEATHFSKVLRERRKSAKGLARLLQQLIGLEAKLNQYTAGENFIAAVEATGGPALVNRAWESSNHLPTMTEIRNPEQWINRMNTLANIETTPVATA